ncbi:uncharacterized protein NDAI_0A07690 [Naumovozyma dairenensis CBS 421]|uniref:Uncharacterized protein n=1 Tax=Naumovozyma dairenensis (strain ATCC 10597 / BCRC 20456 / CBS 421 / NBRC 0211 / NRRL Y-12639) TaxID=1071378 RepID=G0W535_NAUDC|nr:hypothetical protein NDAI_0A07690 [Naumovozyma dairenensis CBS 421]CCD22923.1 hypothetical protein NDAI_0A07690 [Naumovozyma dairenensis CBS 421]
MSQVYSNNSSHSTTSFLTSAPVELTTRKGYEDFINNRKHKDFKLSTVLKPNDGALDGYVLKDGGDVIAIVKGEAMDYLNEIAGNR